MTGPGGGDSDGGSTGPGRWTLTEPTGEPQPFPPPPKRGRVKVHPHSPLAVEAEEWAQRLVGTR